MFASFGKKWDFFSSITIAEAKITSVFFCPFHRQFGCARARLPFLIPSFVSTLLRQKLTLKL
jgi:hypothetical protein